MNWKTHQVSEGAHLEYGVAQDNDHGNFDDTKLKTLGFLNQNKMAKAVKRLKAECVNVINAEDENPSTSTSTRSTEPTTSTAYTKLKYLFIHFFFQNIIRIF